MGEKITFKAGDTVFAKVRGYPFWPARISKVGSKFQVFFYGTHETSFLKASEIVPYTQENRDEFSSKSIKRLAYAQGLEELENTPEIAPVYSDGEDGGVAVVTPKSPKKSLVVKTPIGNTAKASPGRTPKLGSTPKGSTQMGSLTGKRKADNSGGDSPCKAAKRGASEPTIEPEKISRSGRKIKPNHKWTEDGLITLKADYAESSNISEIANPDAVVNDATASGDGMESRKRNAVKKATHENVAIANGVSGIGDDVEDGKTNGVDGSVQRSLWAKVQQTGELVELNIDKNRPAKFDSLKQKLKWEMATARDALKLKKEVENGSYVQPEVVKRLAEKIGVTEEEKRVFAEIRKIAAYLEKRNKRLKWLLVEKRLEDLDVAIKEALHLERPDPERCIEALEELLDIPLTPLVLKKHTHIVKLIKRLRKYVGPDGMTPRDEISKYIHVINQKVEEICLKFKATFNYVQKDTDDGQGFFDEFNRQVAEFEEKTKHLKEIEIIGLITDPTTEGKGSSDD